jgi:RNA polymerase sigma-70 factor (ECF subfamily)
MSMTESSLTEASTRGPRLPDGVLRAVPRRDPKALAAFFDHYYDRVFGYVVMLVNDRTLAEDLAQDAFLKMHEAIDRLDPERDPDPWVFTVVTNTVRDHWRGREQRSASRRVDFEEVAPRVPDENPEADPSRRLEREEETSAVRGALALLSDADREVILLRAYEGLSGAEAAEALGTSHHALRKRYSRAVQRLGNAYESLGGPGRTAETPASDRTDER